MCFILFYGTWICTDIIIVLIYAASDESLTLAGGLFDVAKIKLLQHSDYFQRPHTWQLFTRVLCNTCGWHLLLKFIVHHSCSIYQEGQSIYTDNGADDGVTVWLNVK